ncbi:MAG: hypothetical protein AB7O98_17340 [Hyphomonadaceae bacterium]
MSARRLIVAVTGHRLNQLPERERPRIAAEIADCMGAAENAARGFYAPDIRCELRSAIAEGADRYAADAALQRGWRLVTPLPFSVERYAEDFEAQASKDEYQRLLKASRRVAPVPDQLLARVGGGDAAPYAAVGHALIDKADLLVCVWNGLPPRGPGGTSEVAALMLERGGLVLWIPAQGGPPRLVGPAPLPRAGSFRRKLHEALALRYERTARPAEMRVA